MSKSVPELSEIAKASDVKLAIRDKEHTTGLFNEDNSRASSHDESEITGSNSVTVQQRDGGKWTRGTYWMFPVRARSHALSYSRSLSKGKLIQSLVRLRSLFKDFVDLNRNEADGSLEHGNERKNEDGDDEEREDDPGILMSVRLVCRCRSRRSFNDEVRLGE